jgi:hypothetical protein
LAQLRKSKTLPNPYQKVYVDLGFERGGLFELVQKEYHPREVLYLGCSIHITPAFSFPHTISDGPAKGLSISRASVITSSRE